MENRAFGALATALLLCCVHAAPAMSEPLRILYAEPFQAQPTAASGVQKSGPGALRVQAFGRTFELELDDNSRLLRAASAQAREALGAIQLLKGTVKGAADSWVRLTLIEGRYSGAFWDGSELYAIDSRERLEPQLLVPLPAAATGIYRLSDTQGGLFQGTCALDGSKSALVSPTAKFRALIRELQAVAAATAAREIEVSMVADFELTSRLGSATASNLLEKANIVDGIFSSQLGVSTIPTDFITFATDSDPFTSSDPQALLTQFGDYRAATPAVRSRGLAHLVTGRQLAGSTIGIAFLGVLCDAHAGASLSESSDFIDSALVMAHELGHNFGAPHDAESGSACAATPPSFLMAPQLNFSSTFSTCSLQQMQPRIAAASCVVPSRNRDVAVSVPATTLQTIVNEPFEVPIDLLSVGDTDAVNLILTVSETLGLNILSASLPGAACTVGRDVRCELPALAAGASARLTLRASYGSTGQFSIVAQVLSSNDVNSSNDRGVARFEAVTGRALQVIPRSVPVSVTRGDPFEVDFDVAAIGTQAVPNVDVDVTLTLGRATAASIEGGSCALTANFQQVIHCTTSSVAPGTARRLHAQLISDLIGQSNGSVQAREQGAVSGIASAFSLNTRPARDIELSTDQLNRVTAVGVDAVWPIEVRSAGTHAVDDVRVQLEVAAQLNPVLTGQLAAACTRTSPELFDCSLGTLAGAALVTGQLRARSTVPTAGSFIVHVVPLHADDVGTNDSLALNLDVRVASEISLTTPATQSLFDLRPATLQASIRALGASDSEDVSVDISLPATFSISSARLAQDACTIQALMPNVATCTRPRLLPDQGVALTIEYQAPAPGVYTGSLAVTARDDVDVSNNTRAISFQVAPAVSGSLEPPAPAVFPTGVTRDIVYTLRTNKYTLTDARLDFSWSGSLDEFVATAAGATCSASGTGHSCNFGTLVANSSVPVTVRVRSGSANVVGINAFLFSPAETAPNDNFAFVGYTFLQPGDLTLRTAQPALSATRGQPVDVFFDLTTLSAVLDGYLEITFDPTRVQNPSALQASACTFGTQPVRCLLASPLAPGTLTGNFSFTARSAGPLPITLRVGGRNDFNATNDELSITVNVVDPAPPPPSPQSSVAGGGGGATSWTFAAPLVLLWALMWHHRRARRRVIASVAHT